MPYECTSMGLMLQNPLCDCYRRGFYCMSMNETHGQVVEHIFEIIRINNASTVVWNPLVELFKSAIYPGAMLHHDQTIFGGEIYQLITLLLSLWL